MGSIYQRTTGGTWYYQWYKGNKLFKKSLKTKSRTEAKRLKVRLDAQVDTMKTGLAPKRVGIVEAFKRFYRSKEPLLKPGTLLRYREQIVMMKDFFDKQGVKLVNKLTSENLTEYLTMRQDQGRSNKTIQEEVNLLKAVLKMLLEDGSLSEMPIKRWPRLKTVTKRPERLGAYSDSEVRALMNSFAETEFNDLFTFFLFTGCRSREAASLRVMDVIGKTISIRNHKSESSPESQYRHVEMHSSLQQIMKKRIRGKEPEDLVFPEMQKHSKNWCREQLRIACKSLGIPYRRLHGLRHTFVSGLLAAGVPVRSVMDMVGHEDFETTLRYAHVSQENLKGKIDRLSFEPDEKVDED
ncbi:MAG: hypothetical protein CVV41_04000 [Candidatus Riflebacteria bacterium HGW-Riflebacteria-1]|jgi:integrase|nr:MAG: hypothetical protein CVV41_04000 [Candidatus Riflebacteria bacterium HGW-Riflebacteria-1]